MSFFHLPIPVLNKIYFYSGNYFNNYCKIITQLKYKNMLKEYIFFSQYKLSKNLIGNFILTRIKICHFLKKNEIEGYNTKFQKCWNIFLNYNELQKKYYIEEKIKFYDFIDSLNLCI